MSKTHPTKCFIIFMIIMTTLIPLIYKLPNLFPKSFLIWQLLFYPFVSPNIESLHFLLLKTAHWIIIKCLSILNISHYMTMRIKVRAYLGHYPTWTNLILFNVVNWQHNILEELKIYFVFCIFCFFLLKS